MCDIKVKANSTHKRDIPDIPFAFRRNRELCIAFVMSLTDGGLDGTIWVPINPIASSLKAGRGIACG